MDNNIPFFSIVIPTKNRPNYLKESIQSVLLQNFDDYELIVSDNFNEEPTQNVIKEFTTHPHFKSYRTDAEMNMLDHWEFATKKANGKYVILLPDRKVLYQNALKIIEKNIAKYPNINAFSFGVQTYNETTGRMGWCPKIPKTKLIETNELITNFLEENIFGQKSQDSFFPKTLNGCFRNSYANEIRKKYDRYFNNSGVTTPDYSSFFINCALNDEIVYIGEKLILTQGEQTSNGRLFGAGKFQSYMDSLNIDNSYREVPIKAPLIYNLLIVDFKTIQKKFAGNLLDGKVNDENYFLTNYFEILMKSEQGLNAEGRTFFEKNWNEAIQLNSSSLDPNEVVEKAKKSFSIKNQPEKWDKINRLKYHLKDYLSLRFTEQSLMNRVMTFKYKNALQAANFKRT